MDNPFDGILNSPVSMSMRQKPVTVSLLQPVSGLAYMMIKEDIGAVIVIEKDRLIGIITEKDILDRVVTPGKDVYKTLAKDVMSEPVITVEASSMLKEALELMKKKKIRRLVVVEDGSLVGLVTERRLLEKIVNLII
jgi:CBS domain-containing protein